MMWEETFRRNPTLGVWYARYRSRPSWVIRGAIGAAALVVVVPLVLLTLGALLVGAVVFAVLSLVASVTRLFSGEAAGPVTTTDDGRRNVRVLHR